MKSIQARTAQQIRKELKKAFPDTKFRVTSESFAGGTAVNIRYTDGPTKGEVDNVVNKYEYGKFNGMIDMYEYTNHREDIPQVKYVMTHRKMSDEVREQLVAKMEKEYGQIYNDHDYDHSSIVFREFSNTSFVEPPAEA